MVLVHHGSDLFNYDQAACSERLLITDERTTSSVDYDEYVVYRKSSEVASATASHQAIDHDDPVHYTRDDISGAVQLDMAFRQGYMVDREGKFRVMNDDENPLTGMEGRIRRVVCFNHRVGSSDILSMRPEDLAAMDLHPATLQYATRVTTESRFWSKDRSKLSVILAFSELPKTPYDFLSLTYHVPTRTATILIRQSWEPRREPRREHRRQVVENFENLDEYDQRLESCEAHWAHPLIMPVVLLQVQFMRIEEAVSDNTINVTSLEHDVSNIAGFDGEDVNIRRNQRQLSDSRLSGEKVQVWGPMTMTNLMKKAHEVLRETIKLLDTIRWMERAIKLLILSGDELSERMGTSPMSPFGQDINMLSPTFMDHERGDRPVSPMPGPARGRWLSRITVPDDVDGEADGETLEVHWHEIRQYLDGLLRLCMGLETDRRMSEARCRAQIDMIYSKMAQEDNILNARMAVASSRDSSSMKALAVITAIFLPGEFLGTLFGMSMFDWLGPEGDDGKPGPDGEDAKGNSSERSFDFQFWVYWSVVIPLTLIILCIWRAWWVTQDRYFRRHLSKELSEERFWTSDGKPRELDKSFFWDFFHLSARRDEEATMAKHLAELETINTETGAREGVLDGNRLGSMEINDIRQRQIMTRRNWNMKQRSTKISM